MDSFSKIISIAIVQCLAVINNYRQIIVLMRKRKKLRALIAHFHRNRRRRQLLLRSKQIIRKYRRHWTVVEDSCFWENEIPKMSNEKFKNYFRVDRSTFQFLVSSLSGLEKQCTFYRNPIPLAKRIAIALYAVGSSAEYRTIASLFGVGRTTVGEIVREFCEEVWEKLHATQFDAYPPTDEKIKEIVTGFEKLGFPQCYGAIDGSHIEVKVPQSEATDFFNYKGWKSVVLFAAVDHRYRFTYIKVGTPGRSHDSTIYESSSLKRYHDSPVFQRHTKKINGVNIPILLIGDSAFKLSPNLMKPFSFSVDQPDDERLFNYRLSKCRRVVENAFGHLKARFRRIGKGLEVNLCNTNAIIKAACLLHNLCNNRNDTINKYWVLHLKETVSISQPTRGYSGKDANIGEREAIKNYFANDGLGVDDNGSGNDDDAFELASSISYEAEEQFAADIA